MDNVLSIKAVGHRTGLSPHVIRIWERRYQAVQPQRTATNRRLYNEADVMRLALLHQAVKGGHSISQVASLPMERLRELAAEASPDLLVEKQVKQPASQPLKGLTIPILEKSMAAVERLDASGLEKILSQSTLTLGQTAFLGQVIVPLVERIGEAWQRGALRVAHEHLATAVIRSFLGNFPPPYAVSSTAPKMLVTTPAGQLHELGAILAAVTAHNLGWQVLYLGPSLPVEEIVNAAVQGEVRVVGLSLVYPEDDPQVPSELRRLRRLLPESITLVVGGRAAPAYREVLTDISACQVQNLNELTAALERLRARKRKQE